MFNKVISRQLILVIADILLINFAFIAALLLRFDFQVPSQYLILLPRALSLFTLIGITVFTLTGLYRSLWQYASIRELLHILLAVSLSVSIIYGASLATGTLLPRSVYIITWLLQVFLNGGIRLTLRVFRCIYRQRIEGYLKKVLIIGAGEAGVMVLNELNNNRQIVLAKTVGFIDDDPDKRGKYLHGVKIHGGREEISRLVKELKVDEIIIAMPSAPKREIAQIINLCKKYPVKLKTLPGVYEIIDETVSIKTLRDVHIEDLLGRESVTLNMTEISAYLNGKVVLVTGGGGSIGSELCRQVLRYHPKQLLIFGHGENSVFNIYRELLRKHEDKDIKPLIGSVQDPARLEEVFSRYKPHIVFHAAAHKHVPLMEDNPKEAIKNNVLGTRNMAKTADRHQSEHFVLVSTDKAVNPTSVMGATKRLAEMSVQVISRGSSTRFCAVRFGNVLGSRGSVVPLFREQIEAGGPVTVTHPEMVRYFMTISEAVQLIIQAGTMGKRGEIFILDMGEPIKIVDLANDLIRLSGFEPGRDVEVVFSGVRPGEKLIEETMTAAEGITGTRHEKIFVAKPSGLKDFREELSSINSILGVEERLIESYINDVKTKESGG